MHGLQLWAALPQAHEDAEPGFSHTPAADIPEFAVDGAQIRLLIGGDKLDAPRFMWWNFVSSRKERIQEAADAWAAGRFPPVAGESEFIPLPEKRLV